MKIFSCNPPSETSFEKSLKVVTIVYKKAIFELFDYITIMNFI